LGIFVLISVTSTSQAAVARVDDPRPRPTALALEGFEPRCCAVYHDTLFFGGRWRDGENRADAAPLIAVADGRGLPFPEPRIVGRPFSFTITGISGLTAHDGALVAIADIAGSAEGNPESGLCVYDGRWRTFATPVPAAITGFTDLLSHDGWLVVAGRFQDGTTGVTENVVAWDGVRWRNLGLEMGWQYITHLGRWRGDLIAVTGIRDSELNDEYLRVPVLRSGVFRRADGGRWEKLRAATGGMPTCLAELDGDLLVGFMTLAEAADHPPVLRYDGNEWTAMGRPFTRSTGPGLSKVEALASYRGQLLSAGSFGRPRDGVPGAAAWDGGQWLRLDALELERVRCLAAFGEHLWLGGDLTFDESAILVWNRDVMTGAPVVPVEAPAPAPPAPSRANPSADDVPAPFTRDELERWDGRTPAGWKYGELLPFPVIRDDTADRPPLVPVEGGGVIVPGAPRQQMYALSREFPVRADRVYRARVLARIDRAAPSLRPPARFQLSCGGWDDVSIADTVLTWYELILPGPERGERGRIELRGAEEVDLEVREVQLEELELSWAEIFTDFVNEFGGTYGGFAASAADWDSLVAHWRPIAATAVNRKAFGNILAEMLSALRDPTISLQSQDSDLLETRQVYWDREKENRRQAREVARAQSGRTRGVLTGDQRDRKGSRLLEVAGRSVLLIELHREFWNRHGSDLRPEQWIQVLADSLAVDGLVLDLRGVRSHRHDLAQVATADWAAGVLLTAFPSVPIVALTNEYCVGVGADLALVLSDDPRVTLVGLPTGAPTTVKRVIRLAAGFQVEYPTCGASAPPGRFADAWCGVIPDEEVLLEWIELDDPILERGLEVMARRIRID
jgi:hypothetical protein